MIKLNVNDLIILTDLFSDLEGMDNNQAILLERIDLNIHLGVTMSFNHDEVDIITGVFEEIGDLSREESIIYELIKEYTEL